MTAPSETGTVDVLIVDDQAPFRSAARTLVRLVAGWRVVGEATSGEEAVALAAATRPRIVLMATYAAADLPQAPDGCGAVGYVRKDDLTPAALRALLG